MGGLRRGPRRGPRSPSGEVACHVIRSPIFSSSRGFDRLRFSRLSNQRSVNSDVLKINRKMFVQNRTPHQVL